MNSILLFESFCSKKYNKINKNMIYMQSWAVFVDLCTIMYCIIIYCTYIKAVVLIYKT